MADVLYVSDLDDKQVLEAFERIVKKSKQTGDRADQAFGKASKGSNKLTASMVAGGTAAGALLVKIVELGAKAAKALAGIAAQGVAMNATLEQTEAVFTNLFDDPALGAATTDFIQRTARELRIASTDATSFAQAILPRVRDVEVFTRLLEQATIQARQLNVPVEDLVFSLREAASFDFVSLRDRFDLSRAEINRIKELSEEMDVLEAVSIVVGDNFEKLGKVKIEGTLLANVQELQVAFQGLQQLGTIELFESLRETAERALEIFEEREPDIERVVVALDLLATTLTELITGPLLDFFEGFDISVLEDYVTNVRQLAIAFKAVGTVLSDTNEAVDESEDGFFDLLFSLEGVQQAMITLSKLITLVRAALAGALAPAAILGAGAMALFRGDTEAATQALEDYKKALEIPVTETEVFKNIILEGNAAINASIAEMEDAETAVTDLIGAREEETKATEDQLNAALAERGEREDLTKAIEEAAKAELKIAEDTAEAEIAIREDKIKTLRKLEEKRLDDEIKIARQREDVARRRGDRLAVTELKNQQKLDAIEADLPTEEAAVLRDAANERIEITRDRNNRIADAERQLQQDLLRIRNLFTLDAQEAERNNDVQAFLAAQRRSQQQTTEAKFRRDESITDAKVESETRREELKASLEAELEDVRESNRQKIREFQARLDDELELQRLKDQQEDEAQLIREQRIEADRLQAEQRELESLDRRTTARREKLAASLEDEAALIVAAEELKRDEAERTTAHFIREVDKRRDALRSLLDAQRAAQPRSGGGGGSGQTGRSGRFPVPLASFQGGGLPRIGQPALVGEKGVEAFVPTTPGVILPNSLVQTFMRQAAGGGGGSGTTFNDNRQQSVNTTLSEGVVNNPALLNQMQRVAREEISAAFG